MRDLDDKIAMAVRHVNEGRRIVERQRNRIAEGTAGSYAAELLKTFEQSQVIFEDDLARLIKQRDGK